MTDKVQKPADQTALTARLFSVEMIIWIFTIIFAFGVGYSALAKDTNANTTTIQEIQLAQKDVVSDISDIKISLSGINATRKAEAHAVESRAKVVDRRMDDMKGDIKSVLRILQEGHHNGR